ncbi:hypothetical protein JW930_07450 [Candidatus Woesearchaeota archaeon]|nr:hypothetical protein [Candidatus Woesearchaeota archaeon]
MQYKNRKRFLLFGFLLLFSKIVFAQTGAMGGIERALGLLAQFIDVLDNEIYFKILIWLLVFTLIRYSARRWVFKEKDGSRTANIVALIISLMGTLLLPNEVIRFLFVEYSTIVGLALTLVPVVALFLLQSRFSDKTPGWSFLRFLMFLALGLVTLSIAELHVRTGDSTISTEFATWLDFAGSIFLIGALVSLGQWLGGAFGGKGAAAGDAGKGGGGLLDKLKDWQKKREERKEAGLPDEERFEKHLNRIMTYLPELANFIKDVETSGNNFLNEMRARFVRQSTQPPQENSPIPKGFKFPMRDWNAYLSACGRARLHIAAISSLMNKLFDNPNFTRATAEQIERIKTYNSQLVEHAKKLFENQVKIMESKNNWKRE